MVIVISYAQKHAISAQIGSTAFFGEKAIGYCTQFGYIKQLKNNWHFYSNLNASFADSKGIFKESDAPYNLLHYPHQNYVYGGNGLSAYRIENNEGVRLLPTKPNKFRTWTLNFIFSKTVLQRKKLSLDMGGGLAIGHIMYSKIIDKINGQIENIYPETEINYYIFRYNRFIDLGIATQANLKYQLNNDWFLNVPLNISYFPKSKFDIVNLGLGVGFRL